MKFQNPSIHGSKVNRRTHTHTDRQTDRQAKSNMPFQLFQSWGHKKLGFAGVYLFFLFLLQNIDCGYSLEPPRRGGSNVYPQSMF